MAAYRLELVNCGNRRCQRCRGGRYTHGPYWYAYWREGERVRKRYIGKRAPHGARDHTTPPPRPHTHRGPDDYATIGVAPSSPWEEVRRAYRRAAFAAHPDRGGSTKKMKAINAAFDRVKKARGH